MYSEEKDKECIERKRKLLPLLSDYIDKYAQEKPEELALIEYDTGKEITWGEFMMNTKAFAAKLLDMGLGKGDIIATTLPLLKEHIYLMFACFRIGVIIAPLDLRLKPREVFRCFANIKPKAYFFVGKTEIADFRPMAAELMDAFPNCQHWIQFDINPTHIMRGATGIVEFAESIEKTFIGALLTGRVKKAHSLVKKDDPNLIIFTTGSTGFPKPALLSQHNILIQNIGLKVAFDIDEDDIMCVNLPPSHVGCVTEQLCTTIYAGGTNVLLHIFDPENTLDAIENYNITILGQIPALFAMEWRLPKYQHYDLSSLKFALYGGQAVSKEFLQKLSSMAPKFGTGLGLTETAGFVTYTPLDGTIDDISNSVGYDSPLCPISIREKMKKNRKAGEEKQKGEVGQICFTGEQIFLGYMNDKENTNKTISKDGYCYTGDLGYYDEKGLHLAGRSKFVIKPKGYQVFPTEIENFVKEQFPNQVEYVGCVGAEHEVFSEAIICFIGLKNGQQLEKSEVEKTFKELAAYKRPSHIQFMDSEQFPLNRVAKTDYVKLEELGIEIVQDLRDQGKWDK